MNDALYALFMLLGLTCFLIGLQSLFYYPLALIFALRRRKPGLYAGRTPAVSVVVPAFNEAKTITHCVESILATGYSDLEVILVDDGSTDGTLERMRSFEGRPPVRIMAQPNGGKASALNAGIQVARGEVLFFVDADGIFTPDTITQMLDGFENARIGAVCGTDAPANLNRLQTRLACLQTHVSTGMVRRALAEIDCLPVVSGNIGAFRREALDRAGHFRVGFIGEDLELTWRVHAAGYRVAFAPRALVFAEVPSTLRGLWRQRVRWARGLLQTARLHRAMFFNPGHGLFGFYLPLNVFSMLVIPLLQLLSLILLPALALLSINPVSLDALSLIGWFGLATALGASIFAAGLDRAWSDLRYLYALPLWVPYSLFIDAVALWAIVLELRGKQARWNKIDRTGIVSRRRGANI